MPEDKSGESHEDARDAECPAITPILTHPWDHEEGEEGTQVDGPVESSVETRHGRGVRAVCLVAHEGGNAGLDSASAEGDDEQAHKENRPSSLDALETVGHRKNAMPQAVEERNKQNHLVAPDEAIRHPGAQQGKNVDTGIEEVAHDHCFTFFHRQHTHHVKGENTAHAVKAETLAGLIAHDILRLWGAGA